ncbi:MAG: phosphonate ABC transporter ATP-binding protein [candidate division Zixibacteria bacterium]|nr:phosphonate ABC transporter ATP-binding protein [candidate division Zixibacteria bacterium]
MKQTINYIRGLVVKDLTKIYPNGEKAVNKVSIKVNQGEFVGLIGRSAAGKSTLLRCINRLVEPTSGEVFLNGVNITKLDMKGLREVRRDIGMIFQEFNLVNRLSVIMNVLSGRLGYVSTLRAMFRFFPKEDIERAEMLLEKVGLSDFKNNRVDQLSGGQRQRVGIARALIQEPLLLLVDEPTSSLDPQIGYEIMELIQRISKEYKIPVLISIHNVDLAKEFASRIIALKFGRMIYDGDPIGVDFDAVYKYEKAVEVKEVQRREIWE